MNMRDLDVADSVLDLVGNTPLVNLPRIGEQSPCLIVAKLETTNPGGSSKDRPAITMIDEAEKAEGMDETLEAMRDQPTDEVLVEKLTLSGSGSAR